MKIKRKVKLGDLLKLPITEDLYAVGQVVFIPTNAFEYIVVFDRFYKANELPDQKELLHSGIILLVQISGGINVNPKREIWKIIGNSPIYPSIPLQEFKLQVLNDWVVTGLEGEIIRKASLKDITDLQFQSAFSPQFVINELKVYLGLIEPGQVHGNQLLKTRS